MKNSSKAFVALIVCVLTMSNAQAVSGIQVIESSGKKTASGKPTIVKISTANNEPVKIYELLGTGSVVGSSSSGAVVTGHSETIRFVCAAPCAFKVHGGVHQFKVSENHMLGDVFTVNASGGTQIWEVEDVSAGKGFLGMVLGIIGTSVGIVGLIAGDGGLTMGLVPGAFGVYLVSDARSKARLISSRP